MITIKPTLKIKSQMATKLQRNAYATPFINKSFIHFLTLTYLWISLSGFVTVESKELFDDGSPLSDIDNNEKILTNVSPSDIMENLKRSWKSLQGSWGKRSYESVDAALDDYDNEPAYNLIKPNENSAEYQKSNPEADSDLNTDDELKTGKYFVVFVPKSNGLGKSASTESNIEDQDDETLASNIEKKNWKNMKLVWGKRRSAVWNKFRGAWGKREPVWNNLKGMWGKRSTKDWKKLQSAWGKRSQHKQSV